MLKKESDFAQMTAKMQAYQNKVNELEAMLEQERKAREELQSNQNKLTKMNKQLAEVRTR